MFSPDIISRIVAGWPTKTPLCLLAGSERFSFLALAFTPVSFRDCYDCHFNRDLVLASALPFQNGLMGLLNYSDLNRSMIFQVSKAMIIDWQNRECMVVGESHHDEFMIADAELDRILSQPPIDTASKPITLQPDITDADYLSLVQRILRDIQDGRYYQLNLLRYFSMVGEDVRAACLNKLSQRRAQMSAWIESNDFCLASFSPERFVRVRPDHRHYFLETFPVKGTMARHQDTNHDLRVQQALLSSPKDRAELAIIIDLMRNDFYGISKKRSIHVVDPGSLLSTPHVHHLQGHIQSELRDDVSFGELVKAVFPAGSITGAPKKEVMFAVQEYEKRDRGFFMGSAFYWDARGFFDSSVLIRTAVRQNQKWEFAAGSGLVVKSEPQLECEEIYNKCAVILN